MDIYNGFKINKFTILFFSAYYNINGNYFFTDNLLVVFVNLFGFFYLPFNVIISIFFSHKKVKFRTKSDFSDLAGHHVLALAYKILNNKIWTI